VARSSSSGEELGEQSIRGSIRIEPVGRHVLEDGIRAGSPFRGNQ
jgi:hypothetical protein